jgi:para-nitrobenzyl esterase
MSDQMSEAWANFARDGDPNGGNAPHWQKYNAVNRTTMIWDEQPKGSRIENDPRSEQRKRMLSFGSQQYGEVEPGPT